LIRSEKIIPVVQWKIPKLFDGGSLLARILENE
jgi:hypothetical protein